MSLLEELDDQFRVDHLKEHRHHQAHEIVDEGIYLGSHIAAGFVKVLFENFFGEILHRVVLGRIQVYHQLMEIVNAINQYLSFAKYVVRLETVQVDVFAKSRPLFLAELL